MLASVLVLHVWNLEVMPYWIHSYPWGTVYVVIMIKCKASPCCQNFSMCKVHSSRCNISSAIPTIILPCDAFKRWEKLSHFPAVKQRLSTIKQESMYNESHVEQFNHLRRVRYIQSLQKSDRRLIASLSIANHHQTTDPLLTLYNLDLIDIISECKVKENTYTTLLTTLGGITLCAIVFQWLNTPLCSWSVIVVQEIMFKSSIVAIKAYLRDYFRLVAMNLHLLQLWCEFFSYKTF